MFDSKYFDELAKKLFSTLPGHVKTIEQELQQKFKDILQLAFSRFDLVTREEFDVQTKVLARTREKVEQLKNQIDILVAQSSAKNINNSEN